MMIKKLLIIGLLLIPVRTHGANLTSATCSAHPIDTGCVDYTIGGQGSAAVQITGTWAGTITFRGSLDNTTFVSLKGTSVADVTSVPVTTTTANGTFQFAVSGLSVIRIIFTSYSSGTAVVTFRSTLAASKSVGIGGGIGSVTSIATTSPIGGGTITSTGTITCTTCLTTTALGTGVQTALGINVGSAGAPVLFNGAGGTPSSLVLTNASGSVVLTQATARLVANGATPAVTNTSANSCGTSPATIVGNDNASKVTVGATAGTSCTVTFAVPFSAEPSCNVTNETTANLVRATSTVTAVVVAGTMVAGDVLAVACVGR